MSYVTPRRARAVRAELEEVASLDRRPFPDWSREPAFRAESRHASRVDTTQVVSPAPSLFDTVEATTN